MSKKTNQKPAAQKAEPVDETISKPDADPVDGPIETKPEAPAEGGATEPAPDQAAPQPPIDPTVDSGDQAPAAAAPTEPEEENEDELLSDEEDADEPEDFAPSAHPIQRDPLTIRLAKAVNGLLTSGDPAVVQALHKLEMAVGDLKNALPAAIEASDGLADETLADDLDSILAVL